MKERFTRMNEHIRPSADLVDVTISVASGMTAPKRRLGMALVPVLALLLAFIVATPALAVNSTGFNEMLYRIAPDIALYFRPVNLSDTHNGITVSVLAVDMEEDNAVLYVAVQGDGVTETTDLFDNFYFDEKGTCAMRYATLESYDPETKTAIFRILYVQGHGVLGEGGKVTLHVRRILLEREERVEKVEAFTVMDVPGEVVDVGDRFLHGRYTGEGEVLDYALVPGSLSIPLEEGLSISAAGVVDGAYRIQVRKEGVEMEDDFNLALMTPWQEELRGQDLGYDQRRGMIGVTRDAYWMDSYGTSWSDRLTFMGEDGAVYTDYMFRHKKMEFIEGNHLYYRTRKTVREVEGDWAITFPLTDYTAQ